MLEKNGKITSDRYKASYLEENLSTYQVMMMTKGKIDISKIDIDNQVLAQMKLLGATLDKELNFSNHVSHIFKNTSKRIRFFTRLRKLISTTIKLHIYKAAFMPYFMMVDLSGISSPMIGINLSERGLRAVVFCDWNSNYE